MTVTGLNYVSIYEWYLDFTISIPQNGGDYYLDVTAAIFFLVFICYTTLWETLIPTHRTRQIPKKKS